MVQSIYTTVIQDRFTTWTEQSMWFFGRAEECGTAQGSGVGKEVG